ncbi:hypothetical protein EPZ47_00110 [Pseudomonas viciae]|uniref:PilS N terminal n=1 Tax=Pseudomonas viciae TaxID=2505979 RepID=A0A4P7P9R1_9PSED|nr:hypothetical protein [Pseudomonas viciae]QBZ87181.1 hypothetical protein EPZ47_00110 [Pseudomonas viciae]
MQPMKKQSQRGATLIETSLWLIILGIVVAAAIMLFVVVSGKMQTSKAQEEIITVVPAIIQHFTPQSNFDGLTPDAVNSSGLFTQEQFNAGFFTSPFGSTSQVGFYAVPSTNSTAGAMVISFVPEAACLALSAMSWPDSIIGMDTVKTPAAPTAPGTVITDGDSNLLYGTGHATQSVANQTIGCTPTADGAVNLNIYFVKK